MDMIKTAVIPAAGLGSRLLPATKQQPKEMLPIFVRNTRGVVLVKPVIQLVYERLYDAGLRKFIFIVGRGKRSIEDHFTIDARVADRLKGPGKVELTREMRQFNKRIENSSIVFVNQPEPLGFGDAVLRAKAFTNVKHFLVQAGDDLIVSKNTRYFERVMRTFQVHQADMVFFVQKVADPSKYGVIQGVKVANGLYQVRQVEEKPRHPKSKLAIVAIYVSNRRIYHYLENSRKLGQQLELTPAIQGLIRDGGKVLAVELNSHEIRVDVGSPDSYWLALRANMR
jgi:UTP--glucose-1-phosphate uridylyltransferase